MKSNLILILLSLFLIESSASAQNFSLPKPPAELRSIPQRAGWLICHYWDNACAQSISESDSQSEQAFVNFFSVFPVCNEPLTWKQAMENMLKALEKNTAATSAADAFAEKYLYELSSPVASDEIYLSYIDAALDSQCFSEPERERLRFRKMELNNNRIGSKIEHFIFMDRTGNRVESDSLKGEKVLVLFDPDCADCKVLIESLKGENEAETTIIAIAVNTNEQKYSSFKTNIPDHWIYGWDKYHSVNGQAFAIRHLPMIMRVDSLGTIVSKGISVEAVRKQR